VTSRQILKLLARSASGIDRTKCRSQYLVMLTKVAMAAFVKPAMAPSPVTREVTGLPLA
jgi:hypothetical protein